MNLNENIGAVIRHIRKSKGLTQAELSKEGTRSHICTIRHLRKIERGQITPNAPVLNQLLAVLGVSLADFALMLYGEQMIVFNNEMEAVRNLFFEEEYALAEEKFEKLRQQDFFDTTNPIILQSVLLYEGMILKYRHKQHQACLEKLHEALRVTSSKILKNNVPNVSYIAKNPLSLNEYRILMMIVNAEEGIEEEFGSTSGRIEILSAMCESLENVVMDSETRNKLLPAAYFNLSNTLLADGEFTKAMKVAEKGIALCQEAKVFRLFGKLLWNKGRAFFHLNDKIRAIEYFQKSHDSFILHGSTETAEYLRKSAAERYGVWLTRH